MKFWQEIQLTFELQNKICAMSEKISVVIPVYRNEKNLINTCEKVMAIRRSNFSSLDFEILFVEDGSDDQSWAVLKQLRDQYPDTVSLIKLTRNFGQVNAIIAGYTYASGDAVITISADLQDPVELMPKMFHLFTHGYDVVIAHRDSRDDDLFSNIFSKVAYSIAHYANPKIPTGGFDYLLLSKRAAKILAQLTGRHRFFQGDITWLGFPVAYIPYTRQVRVVGKSGWTLSKKFKYFVDLVLDSSYFPIRMMSFLGITISIFSAIYSCVIIYSWSMHSTPFPGWAPIMIVQLFLGGLIMLMLGVIGEYVWRIYDEVKGRPSYLVEQIELANEK